MISPCKFEYKLLWLRAHDDSGILRYQMLRTSTRVRVGKVAFPGCTKPEAAVKALQNIPKDTYIWELNGELSSDIVKATAISVILPHPSQGLPPGERILAGSARLANHHCDPNSVVGCPVAYDASH